MPAPQEQRPVAGRHAAKGMRGGIVRAIGLGLDDPPGHLRAPHLADDNAPQQPLGQRKGVGGQRAAGDVFEAHGGVCVQDIPQPYGRAAAR